MHTYPICLEGRLDPGLSRWKWLVKWLLTGAAVGPANMPRQRQQLIDTRVGVPELALLGMTRSAKGLRR